jgi:hypothetical protein
MKGPESEKEDGSRSASVGIPTGRRRASATGPGAVVRHQSVRQQANGPPLLGLAQQRLAGGVVAVLVEEGGAIHGPV